MFPGLSTVVVRGWKFLLCRYFSGVLPLILPGFPALPPINKFVSSLRSEINKFVSSLRSEINKFVSSLRSEINCASRNYSKMV